MTMSENKNDSMSHEIRFVIPEEDGCEKISDIMKAAFEAMQCNSFDPLWITETECFHITEKLPKLFIFDPFEGKAYNHLASLKCRILGPLCILECLQTNQSLPYRPYPVYSLTMRKITITSSNIDKKVREEISKKVELMGGYFNKDLTKSVTHLVVGSVSSNKYNVAINFGLPIMMVDWVYDCWNTGQYQQIHSNNEIYKKYLCPPFYGLNITVSQLTNEERKNVKDLIEKNGGKYSGAMRAKEITHLILLEPKGEKYKFAKAWKIKCVNLNWLYDSLKAGYCKDEKFYQLDEEAFQQFHTSTPEKGNSIGKMKNINCSTIYDNNSSCPESRLEETANVNSTIIIPANHNSSLNILNEFNEFLTVGQFLDGCRIFVNGFSGLQLEKIYKIINAGGGMRFSKLNENITHTILGEKDENILRFIEEQSIKCHVVSYLWLINCYKEQTLLDEEPYRFIKNINLSPQISSKAENIEHSSAKSTETHQLNNFENISVNHENNFSNVVNQHLPKSEIMNLKSVQSISDQNIISEINLFSGLSAVISDFESEDTNLLSEMFVSAGGKIATADSLINLCIVPLFSTSSANFKAVNVVTNYWLQLCIEQKRLLQFDFNLLCKPLFVNSEILKGCVISFSQYVGVERDGLTELAEKMGACCQDYFVRKANKVRGLYANTHLIVAIPEGNKYEASKKWNIPAVTKDWLFQTAKIGKRVTESDYFIDLQSSSSKHEDSSITLQESKSVHSFIDISKNETMNLKNGSIPKLEQFNEISVYNCVQNKRITELTQESKSLNSTNESLTPSKFLNSKEDYHPDYDINPVLAILNTSTDNINSKDKDVSLPIQEHFTEKISAALKNIGVVDDPINNTENDYEYDKNSAKPLKGVILCVSKKLSNKQAELNKIVHSLGGDFRWNYSSDCTHFVYQGKSSVARDFKTAQEQGKKIVSFEWVYACRDAFALIDENQYSPTYNRRLSLLGQVSAKKLSKPDDPFSERSAEVNNLNDFQLDKNRACDKEESKALNRNVFSGQDNGNDKDISKEIEELLNASKRKTENSSYSANHNSKEIYFINNIYNNSNFKETINSSENDDKICKNNLENKIDVLPLETFTQSIPITWDDPTGRSEREKLADHINQANRTTTESFSPHSNIAENEIVPVNLTESKISTLSKAQLDNLNAETNKLQQNSEQTETFQKKKFMFSGLSENEKLQYSVIIRNLGGIVLDAKTFDKTGTHLILGQPLKNEKFLASVASGLWVLHKNYIESCEQAGYFVNEEMYEWGGPMTYSLEHILNKFNKVALCPRRWRIKIQEKTNTNKAYGAFSDWKVLVIADRQKSSTYKRILESGGAAIIKSYEDLNNVTHAFIELPQEEFKKIDLESLVSSGINCLKPEYLAFYLIEINPPLEEKFLIPQVKELIDKYSNRKRKLEDNKQSNNKYLCER